MRSGSCPESEKLRMPEMQLFYKRKSQVKHKRKNKGNDRSRGYFKQGRANIPESRGEMQKMQERRMLFLDCSNAFRRRSGDKILQVHEMRAYLAGI